jgi:hypothetical protein
MWVNLLASQELAHSSSAKSCFRQTQRALLELNTGIYVWVGHFFIWGIAVLLKGGPGAAKAAAGAFYLGLKFSLILAVCVGITGFIWGDEKLVRLLGILWGTDQEFNDELDSRVRGIPMWMVYLFLILAIIGSYGYLAVLEPVRNFVCEA